MFLSFSFICFPSVVVADDLCVVALFLWLVRRWSAAVVAQFLALGVQLHTRHLVRSDVLRHIPLEDEGADATCAQVTIELKCGSRVL